jgi:hypothetical protein
MHASEVERFAESGQSLADVTQGLEREHLLWIPPPEAGVGLWSIQQVIIHLMDSDLIWTARLKQIVAEDNPHIVAYDESKFAEKLFCEQQSAVDAITIFTLNRRNFARVLRALPESAWDRTGRHQERGEIRLGACLEMMQQHLSHHAAFIRQKRTYLGL